MLGSLRRRREAHMLIGMPIPGPHAMTKQPAKARRFDDPRVAALFDSYPEPVRSKLLALRELIFDTASEIEDVGKLEETLRWGEPSYLTTESGSGSMVRINAKGSDQYAMYFHCQTNLVETFRQIYADRLKFEKNRAIVFDGSDKIPMKELRHCISMALTYHRDRNERQKRSARRGK
jgi:hypothetical protein